MRRGASVFPMKIDGAFAYPSNYCILLLMQQLIS